MQAAHQDAQASAIDAFAFYPSPAGRGCHRGAMTGEGLLPFLPSSLSATHNQEPLIRQPAAATLSMRGIFKNNLTKHLPCEGVPEQCEGEGGYILRNKTLSRLPALRESTLPKHRDNKRDF